MSHQKNESFSTDAATQMCEKWKRNGKTKTMKASVNENKIVVAATANKQKC